MNTLHITPELPIPIINKKIKAFSEHNREGIVHFKKGEYLVPRADGPIILQHGLNYIGNNSVIKRAPMPAVPDLPEEMLHYLNANFDDVRNSQLLRLLDNNEERISAILERDDEFALRKELKIRINGDRVFRGLVEEWLTTASAWHWKVDMRTAPYDGEEDADPIVIQGFTFDGNSANQWDFDQYQFQHAHLLLIGEARSIPAEGEAVNPERHNIHPGRINVQIAQCVFQNGVADGVSIISDTIITIKKCKGHNVFRGEITLTGGNTSIEIDNYKGQFVQIEIDGSGFGSSYDMKADIRNIDVDHFQITAARGVFEMIGDNIKARKTFVLHAPKGIVSIKDSQFYSDGNFAANHIFMGPKIDFFNCDFRIDTTASRGNPQRRAWNNREVSQDSIANKHKRACVHIRGKAKNSQVNFDSCRFYNLDRQIFEDSLGEGGIVGVAFHENRLLETRSFVHIIGSHIAGFVNWGIQLETGGRLIVRHTLFDVQTAFWLMSTNNDTTSGFVVDLIVENTFFEDLENYAFLNIGVPKDRISHDTVALFHEHNNIIAPSRTFGRALKFVTFEGGRTIGGRDVDFSIVQDGLPGLPGDRLTLTNTDERVEWVCKESEYSFTGTVTGEWSRI